MGQKNPSGVVTAKIADRVLGRALKKRAKQSEVAKALLKEPLEVVRPVSRESEASSSR
jgi:hypothetical protein